MGSIRLEDNATFWDNFSRKYDGFIARTGGVYATFIDRIAPDLVRLGSVLDVAAGTGTLALHLAPVANHIDGIDLAPGMIAQAKKKAAARGVSNVEFHVGSAYRLPFETGTFDSVLCTNALHVMEHPERTLAEIRRVCKPGARLVAPTFCHGQTLRSRLMSRVLGLFGFRAYHRYTLATLCGEVERAGLVVVSCDLLPGMFPLAYLVAQVAEGPRVERTPSCPE